MGSQDAHKSFFAALREDLWDDLAWAISPFWSWPGVLIIAPSSYLIGVTAMYEAQYELAVILYFVGVVLFAAKATSHSQTEKQKGRKVMIIIIASVAFLALSLYWVKYIYQAKTHQPYAVTQLTASIWPYIAAVGQWPWRWILPTAVMVFILTTIVNVKRERQRQSPAESPETVRLRAIAKTDKERIKNLVRIPWILYHPHFDEKEPYIDFVFVIFNNSLYDIAFDSSIKGDIWSDSSERPFHYEPKIHSHHPIKCSSRSGTNFLIRHPLTKEEVVARFEGRDNVVIWFDTLQITFAGTEQFPEIGSTQLETRFFCLETKKGAWRNPNENEEFAFLYTDDQWAALKAPSPQGQTEIEQALIQSRADFNNLQDKYDKVLSQLEDKGRVFFEVETKARAFDHSPSHAVIFPEPPEIRQRSGFIKVKFRFNNTSAHDNAGKVKLELLRINSEGKEEIAVEIRNMSGQLDKGVVGGGVDFEHIPIKANEPTPYIWMFCNFLVASENEVKGAFVRLRIEAHRQPPEDQSYDVNWNQAWSGDYYSDLTPRNRE